MHFVLATRPHTHFSQFYVFIIFPDFERFVAVQQPGATIASRQRYDINSFMVAFVVVARSDYVEYASAVICAS
jgi:hypothetical protein